MPVFDDFVPGGTGSGTYVDQGDLELMFGVKNIRVWSNLENDSATTTDALRVTEAILQAEAELQSLFEMSSYSWPIPTDPRVRRWVCTLAVHWLYMSRGLRETEDLDNKLEALKNRVLQEVKLVLLGASKLQSPRAEGHPTAPGFLIRSGRCRVYRR